MCVGQGTVARSLFLFSNCGVWDSEAGSQTGPASTLTTCHQNNLVKNVKLICSLVELLISMGHIRIRSPLRKITG